MDRETSESVKQINKELQKVVTKLEAMEAKSSERFKLINKLLNVINKEAIAIYDNMVHER